GAVRALTTDSEIVFYAIPLNNSYAYACAGASLEPAYISSDRIKPTGGAIYQTDLSDYFDELSIMSGSSNSIYISKLNAGELWNRESYEALLMEFKNKMNELGLNDIVAGLNEQIKEKEEMLK
ncbi:MAG: hypothetical protein J6B39_06105, partial [Lachnospiraceae bacterium]|nr:hypothetical protein [Lachnospiraceae bacterium]